ncbi:MAG: TraU family protein [Candidatus Omnitrophica bacterium]|nr:TraU family protein [Candidatus Omnitrophota bacterium]
MWIVKSVFMCLFVLLNIEARAESLATIASRIDWSCIHFQQVGPCVRKTPPFAGVKVRYWQPVLFIETVKKPGDVVVDEFRALVGGFLSRIAWWSYSPDRSVPLTSSSSVNADSTSLQMNEVHVMAFPLTDMFSTMTEVACEGMPDYAGSVNYLSEMDASEWREGRCEAFNLQMAFLNRSPGFCEGKGRLFPALCLGSWGPIFPRTGFLTHYSDAVGSAVSAYRGVHIASIQIATPHIVLSRILFSPSVRYDKMQMVVPERTACMNIGTDPAWWENGRRSKDGRYAWIYWRKKECCLSL